MAIITISRGSYSKGSEVAEKVAKKLGYECIARDVLLEASEQFNVPQAKLVSAIEDAPSFLDRIGHGRKKYITYISAALLRHFQKDNVVYHGLAGHYFVQGVSHVLKVRILADHEDRISVVAKREGVGRKQAEQILKRIDHERQRWGKCLYGIDTTDPSVYDMVLHIRKITVDDAVNIICHTVSLEHFQTTPESQSMMDSLVLAAEVKSSLIEIKSDIEVTAVNGVVNIRTQAPLVQMESLISEIEVKARKVSGVKDVKVDVDVM